MLAQLVSLQRCSPKLSLIYFFFFSFFSPLLGDMQCRKHTWEKKKNSALRKYSRWLRGGARYLQSCLNQQYILHVQHPWDRVFGAKGAGISLTENGLVGNSSARLSSGFSPIDWLMLWEPV